MACWGAKDFRATGEDARDTRKIEKVEKGIREEEGKIEKRT